MAGEQLDTTNPLYNRGLPLFKVTPPSQPDEYRTLAVKTAIVTLVAVATLSVISLISIVFFLLFSLVI